MDQKLECAGIKISNNPVRTEEIVLLRQTCLKWTLF